MNKLIKGLFRLLGYIILILIILFGAFLIYSSMKDYQPEKIEPTIDIINNENVIDTNEFSLMIWNIGFGGLGAEMDFFYDDGVMVRPTQEQNEIYNSGIKSFLNNNDSIDFMLIQEVDVDSKRTYRQNQKEALTNLMDEYNSSYLTNYDAWMVPMPPTNPLGKVEAGMMTLSKFKFSESKRYALPEVYSWPMKHFMLDRGFIFNTFPLDNGKNLIIINVHNSAYVNDEAGRIKELNVIKDLAIKEFEAGNYVVIGGDWNMNPPDYSKFVVDQGYNPIENDFKLSADLFPVEWNWTYDPSVPTNREIDKPFVKGSNTTTIIDFFLLSPNIKSEKVKTLSQDFMYSDHEAVYLKIKLK